MSPKPNNPAGVPRGSPPPAVAPGRHVWLVLAALLLAGLVGACQRESQQPEVEEGPTINVALNVDPSPAAMGPALLEVILEDEEGQPIEGASVSVRGDMTHAGMAPVFGDSSEAEPGRYLVPFEWTMGGDWIVEVWIELPDGSQVQRTYDLSVSAGDS